MNSINYLDTSALIKLLLYPDIPEPGSKALYSFRASHTCFYTLDLCIGEALNVLKQKFFSKDNKRKVLSRDGYLMRVDLLRRMTKKGHSLHVVSTDLTDDSIAQDAFALVSKFKIDFVDALVAVKARRHKPFAKGQNLFITSEKHLTKAAESIGLTVWCCSKDSSKLPTGVT